MPPQTPSPAWCRTAALIALLAPAGAAQALALAPGQSRELASVMLRNHCEHVVGELMVCASTDGSSFDSGVITGRYGATSRAQITAFADGFDGTVRDTAVVGTGDYIGTSLTAVQFDTFTITGPGSTVPLDVRVYASGTTAASAPGHVTATYQLKSGIRSPLPVDNRVFTSGVQSVGAYAITTGRTASLSSGVYAPSVSTWGNGRYEAPVGTPFEYGFELVLYAFNTTMDFDARVEFTLPEGYAMTSTRGIAVNVSPVPEPGRAALLAVGLLGLAWRRRSRSR